MAEEPAEAVFTDTQDGHSFYDTGSSGSGGLFGGGSCSPSSFSSSSSSSVPVVGSLRGGALCTSCGQEIVDRYLLQVNGLCWHVRCLSCSVCNTSLGRHVSCYVKDTQVFCKLGCFRGCGARCARCGRGVRSAGWVRRAGGGAFRLACFSCASCGRRLSAGGGCGLLGGGVFCRPRCGVVVENLKRSKENEQPRPEDGSANKDSSTVGRPAKRARTSFTVDQLQVMQAQFAKDNNPDAQTLQRLAEKTGLSRRVIQVWFQNCRARQKKHINPNHGSSGMLTSIGSGQLTPPLMDNLQYTTYINPDPPLLTTLTYMDVQTPDPLLLQPLLSHPLTQLPINHT